MLFGFRRFVGVASARGSFVGSLYLCSPFSRTIYVLFCFYSDYVGHRCLFLFRRFGGVSGACGSSCGHTSYLSDGSRFVFRMYLWGFSVLCFLSFRGEGTGWKFAFICPVFSGVWSFRVPCVYFPLSLFLLRGHVSSTFAWGASLAHFKGVLWGDFRLFRFRRSGVHGVWLGAEVVGGFWKFWPSVSVDLER